MSDLVERHGVGWVWIRKPIVAGALLLLTYVGLSLLMSPNGFLGTDTGGKVATLKVMADRHDLNPDIGYWANEWDPSARVHGMYFTSRVGNRFVNVTSLPMVIAAEPLYRLGGYRFVLVLPMAGSMLAAFAARGISRRIRPGDGWIAFWLVGLASPMTIYALDFWEHSLGAALLAWAAIALWDFLNQRCTWLRSLAVGALIGAAFAMRTEALAYGFVMVVLAGAYLALRRREVRHALVLGIGAVSGLALLVAANWVLELMVLGSSVRSGRAASAVTGGGASVGSRLNEAFVTLFSPVPTAGAQAFLLGAVLTLALAGIVWCTAHRRGELVASGLAAVAIVIYLIRFADGVGFVPGLVAASPVAVVAIVLGWNRGASRFFVLMAIGPLPVVFAFAYLGGALPQWAGRYLLTTGLILVSVGAAHLSDLVQWARRFFVFLAVAVTLFGLLWLSIRSHEIERAANNLENRSEAVLISPDGFVPREFGATYGRKPWLATGSDDDLRFAVGVVAASGKETFAIVDLDTNATPPSFSGWVAGVSELVPYLDGAPLRVTSYSRVLGATLDG